MPSDTTPSAACEIMRMIGPDAMDEICRRFGGERIYIPHALPERNGLIVEEFDRTVAVAPSVGSAYETVAQIYHVHTRTIERIIANSRQTQP